MPYDPHLLILATNSIEDHMPSGVVPEWSLQSLTITFVEPRHVSNIATPISVGVNHVTFQFVISYFISYYEILFLDNFLESAISSG